MKKRLGSIVVSLVISVALIAVLLRGETLGELLGLLPQLRWEYVVAAVLVGPVVQYLRAWRFQRLLFAKTIVPEPAMFRIAVYLNFFNYILPFRIGELSFPMLMKREYNEGFANSIGILLLVRIGDLIAVVGLAGTALALAGNELIQVIGAAFAVGALVALMLLLVLPLPIATAGGRWLGPRFERFLTGLLAVSRQNDRSAFVMLTVALWAIQFVACYFCLLAVGEGFTYIQGVIGGAAAILSFSLPINGFAGIGPAQAAWAYALNFLGVEFSQAVASSILFGIVVFVSITLQAAGVFAWHQISRMLGRRAPISAAAGGSDDGGQTAGSR